MAPQLYLKSPTTLSPIHRKSTLRTASHSSFRSTHNQVIPLNLYIKRVSPYDSINVNAIAGSHVARARQQLLSAGMILASKVIAQQQDTKKLCSGPDGLSTTNGHPTLSHVTVKDSSSYHAQFPKSLSIDDPPLELMHGSPLRVAYHGIPGTYSEAAARKAYPCCEAIPCDELKMAFEAVELCIADIAVLPVENSLGGSIHHNYDMILRYRLHIVGEVQLPVHHCLLALPGIKKHNIIRVISHPQALSQCENTLTKMGLKVIREAANHTAGAAKYIAQNNLQDTAAIASSRAAELYRMQILAEGIHDDSRNVTRFVMLAREPIIPWSDRPFRTSIVFAQDKGTSMLFKVLSAFAFRNISLTKIEARPHRSSPLRLVDYANVGTAKHFEYMFYADFEASLAEALVQNALAEVQKLTSFLRVPGSYPMDMTPWTPTSSQE